MKKILFGFFVISLLLAGSCQKGIHWSSVGELRKDSLGNCLPVTVAGIYAVNKVISDSNFIIVSVNVIAGGSYFITNDTANGYSFSASGAFSSKGIIPVKLLCKGIPRKAGIDFINLNYDNSVCEIAINVLPDAVPKAGYTLQGSPGRCMDDSVHGSYIQSITLDTSDFVSISVNVQSPGNYSMFTDTINGYSFSAVGLFTVTGIQTVILAGAGIPANTGNNTFKLTASTSACSFPVTVIPVVQAKSKLHFPLTAGSYWVYVGEDPNDTITRYVNGDTIIDGTSYIRVTEKTKFISTDYFYHYNGTDYTEYGRVEVYTTLILFNPPVYGATLFLKESAGPNAYWESQVFTGKESFDDKTKYDFHSKFYCISNTGNKEVNGLGFRDVINMKVTPYVVGDNGSWIGGGYDFYNYHYAKGVGLIDIEYTGAENKYPDPLKLVSWKVN